MKRILIPTDFSELGDYAYNMAMSLFQKDELEIHVLSIVSVTPDVLFDEYGELLDDGIIDFKLLKNEEKEMNDLMDQWLKGKSNIAESKVKLGRLSNDVIHYVNNNDIDLLIMGTSGASGMKELLVGSHTAYIAMRSPVPVLSIKSDRSGFDAKKILLAGDFKDPQMVDLSVVKYLAKTNDATMHLLKVNTPGDFETNEAVEARMKEFAELNELERASFNIYCDYSIEKGIASFAQSNDMDLLAIGSQQRTGLSRIIRKSISYDAINHIKQPIITFPVK